MFTDVCSTCARDTSSEWRFCRSCGAPLTGEPIDEQGQWHVARSGNRLGPFGVPTLREMARDGRLVAGVVVWRPGMAGWQPVETTELAGLLFEFGPQRPGPPPLPAGAVDNRLVWWLVSAPILGVLVQYAFAPSSPWSLWWVTLALNVVLCCFDDRRLKEAGYTVEGPAFLVPVYLFKRAALLGEQPSYAWAWCAVFFLSLFM